MRTISLCFILGVFLGAAPALAQQRPEVVPDAERRADETLTERLDRTDSVIKPPPVDSPMRVAPPPVNSSMPVIKPDQAPVQQSEPGKAGE